MSSSVYIWIIFIIVFLFLYLVSAKFKYYFKFTIFITLCTASSIILLPLAITRPKNLNNLIILARLCRMISPFIGVEWILKGEEYISRDESYIVMANHQSGLDVLGMFHIWPILGKGTAVAKEELKFVWPFGLFLWLTGVLFIPRSKGEKSKEILNRELLIRKKDKVKLWIFPEGTRCGDGKIHNFKKGGFHMALSAQIPILPVVFSYYSFLDHERKCFNEGKVLITILPPVDTKGYSLETMDDLVSVVRAKMIRTFEKTSSFKMETTLR